MTETGPMAGLVLAGGRSRRFGGEKAGALLGGRPLVRIALDRTAADCWPLAVSAARGSEAERLGSAAGAEILHDADGAPDGPLAGILAGMAWARREQAALLATLPCDLPLAPRGLFLTLRAALRPQDGAAVARTPDGLQALCLVTRTDRHESLAALLAGGLHPPVREWLASIGAREVLFDDPAPFANVNTRQDLERLAARLS
jgi:molybdopterin-guanine dinucleotide biosynthesis protein A